MEINKTNIKDNPITDVIIKRKNGEESILHPKCLLLIYLTEDEIKCMNSTTDFEYMLIKEVLCEINMHRINNVDKDIKKILLDSLIEINEKENKMLKNLKI